jgi:hypothetical protein
MRIWSNTGHRASRLAENQSSKSSALKKSEIIADIFNHKPPDTEDKRDAKLHLSNTSKALQAQYRSEVSAFLKENASIQEHLSKIELEGEKASSEALMSRKLGAYVNWLRIRQNAGENLNSGADAPYQAIHNIGKDEEIKAIVENNEERRQQVNAARKAFMPNYYYMVYPETYSFN